MSFVSVEGLLQIVEETKKTLWEVILEDDINERKANREDSIAHMKSLWDAMCKASENYNPDLRSASGLSGGDGEKMKNSVDNDTTICGNFIGKVISQALQMGESNACMKRIVAAPTAGACGVLPAILIPFQQQNNIPDEKMIEALYVSAGFGQIFANRAFISGAAGGCQAEVGVASAMGAATLVFLKGGTAKQSANACGMAIKNLMGLVCDPVAGLVEVPCIKRNVIGAMNALACADMALAGIESVIPVDEVIDAMREVGACLPTSLRETGKGGIAASKTGIEIAKKLHGE